MKNLKQFEKINIDKIKSFIEEFKTKNSLVYTGLISKYKILKYIMGHPELLICYGCNDDLFDFISPDIKGLKGYVDSHSVDNKDTYGYRTNALRAEVIGNYAVLEKQKSLLSDYKWTINGVPFSYYKNGFNQSDMGHLNLNLEVKSSGLFSERGFAVESKHGFSNELLVVRCVLRELSNFNITTFNDLDGVTELYFVLGVLPASVQFKYITDTTECMPEHPSKKYLPLECYSNIVPLDLYDISESTTPIHLLNIVNNEQLRNQMSVLLFELMGKLKIDGLKFLKTPTNTTLPTYVKCKERLKSRNNFNSLSVIDIKKIRILQNFQILNSSDKLYFNLFYLTDEGIEYRRELSFDPHTENGEDFLHENGLSNCILIGSGVRSLIELIQKGCKNTNKEIEKTCLILDESDLADIIDADYSMSIKRDFLKAIRVGDGYKKIDWFQSLLTLTLLHVDKNLSDSNCSFITDMGVLVKNLGSYYTEINKRCSSEPELKKNLKLIHVLPLLYSIGYSISLLCSRSLSSQFRPIINQRFPSIIVTKDSYYSYNRDLGVYSTNGIFPNLNIYVEPPFKINKEDLMGSDGIVFDENSLTQLGSGSSIPNESEGSNLISDVVSSDIDVSDSVENSDNSEIVGSDSSDGVFNDSLKDDDIETHLGSWENCVDNFSKSASESLSQFTSADSENSVKNEGFYKEANIKGIDTQEQNSSDIPLGDENNNYPLESDDGVEKNNSSSVSNENTNLQEKNKNNSEKNKCIFSSDIPMVSEKLDEKNNDPYIFGNTPNFDPHLLELEKIKDKEIKESKFEENVDMTGTKNTLKNTENKLKLLDETVENADDINRKNILIEQLKYFNLYYSYSGFISMSELYSKKSIDKVEFLGYLVEYLGQSDESMLSDIIDLIKKRVL